MEPDDADDDEDGEAGDLPSPSSTILLPFHLLCLLLLQQSFQDQLQSLGVNVPGEKGSCFIQLLDVNNKEFFETNLQKASFSCSAVAVSGSREWRRLKTVKQK